MKEDQHRFLMLLRQLPARLTAEQTAWVLNCQSHDIPGLISARLIKPLGNPPPNGFKFFATTEILELTKDKAWLTKMSNAIYNHWRSKNATKKNRFPVPPENGVSSLPASSDSEEARRPRQLAT